MISLKDLFINHKLRIRRGAFGAYKLHTALIQPFVAPRDPLDIRHQLNISGDGGVQDECGGRIDGAAQRAEVGEAVAVQVQRLIRLIRELLAVCTQPDAVRRAACAFSRLVLGLQRGKGASAVEEPGLVGRLGGIILVIDSQGNVDFTLVIFHARIVSKRAAVDRAALVVVHQCGFPKRAVVDRAAVLNRRVNCSLAIVDRAALLVGHAFFQRGVEDLAPVLNSGGELAVADLAALLVVHAPTCRADLAVGNLAVVMQSIRITQRNPAVRGAFYGAIVGQITAGQRLDAAQRSTFFNNHGVATGKRRQRIRVVRLRSVVIPDDRQCFGVRIIRPDLIGRQLAGRADGEFRIGGGILQLHRVAHGPGLAAAAEQAKAELERAVRLGGNGLLTNRPFGDHDLQTVGCSKALATLQGIGQRIAHRIHTRRAGLAEDDDRADAVRTCSGCDKRIAGSILEADGQLKIAAERFAIYLGRNVDGVHVFARAAAGKNGVFLVAALADQLHCGAGRQACHRNRDIAANREHLWQFDDRGGGDGHAGERPAL